MKETFLLIQLFMNKNILIVNVKPLGKVNANLTGFEYQHLEKNLLI